MARHDGSYFPFLIYRLGFLVLFGKFVLTWETAVHVYFGCVNVIPMTEGAKPMALCAEKGARIVYGDSAIIQAGFADHMDDWEKDYPRLEQVILWPPETKDVYIGGDLCIYPQQYRPTYEAPNIIFGQCIQKYYDRGLGKVSNPYYVWYHNKDLKGENLSDPDALLSAGADEYQDLIVALTEQQQQLGLPLSEGEQDSGAAEEDLFAPTENLNFNDHENGLEDIDFSALDAANAGVENLFTTLPAFTGNDLDQPSIASLAKGEGEGAFSIDDLLFSKEERNSLEFLL